MSDYTWFPSQDYLDTANVSRLMGTLGVSDTAALRARSVADIGAFWDEVLTDLGIEFGHPYSKVVDLSGGIEHPEWFVDGQINIVDACLVRWARATPDTPAVVHEREDGQVRTITYAQLDELVARTRAGLRAHGIGKGDAVAVYLPMTPEAVIATYAIASIGAVVVPLFSGFAPTAIASRLQDAEARAVFVADGTIRRGKTAPMASQLTEALTLCPTVELVVTVNNVGPATAGTDGLQAGTDPRQAGTDFRAARTDPRQAGTDPRQAGTDFRQARTDPRQAGTDFRQARTDPREAGTDFRQAGTDPRQAGTDFRQARTDPREISWDTLLDIAPDLHIEPTSASDVLLLAYTSGTTGRPKGAVHTHAGFLTKVASEVAYGFDLKPGGVFCWITDMGWIMGPISIFGTHSNGGTLLLYEGSPDVPDTTRLWQLVERHRVAMLGVSPTLIRTLRAAGLAAGVDLSSVRTVGSTGEPWDPDSYQWLARDVFGSRVPIINFSGGTEVGGSFLCPYPVEPIESCSLGGPALGMDVDVVDDQGQSLRGSIGELICRQPWPSMTRGIWRDPERYHEAYFSTFSGLWRHGDYALVDDSGSWFILGRSDDVMNVAGKRIAPAEIESVLQAHPGVVESAVVGIPDPVKGESLWAFWVGRPGTDTDPVEATAAISAELRSLVATEVGKPFAPSHVIKVGQLPKTRSAKILRRAVRAAVLDTDAGDLSGAENPEAVEEIRRQVKGLL